MSEAERYQQDIAMLREQLELSRSDCNELHDVREQLKIRLEDTNQELEKEQRSGEDAVNEVSYSDLNLVNPFRAAEYVNALCPWLP